VVKRLAWVLFSFCSLSLHAEENISKSVLACAGYKEKNERLICYDRLAESLAAGSQVNNDIKAPAPEELFGMSTDVRSPERKEPGDERAALESITQRVTQVRAGRDGGAIVTLENGQIWQQVDGKYLLVEVGDTVTISRAAFGTFRLGTTENRSARVKRVR
jgi:hypothetical protein